MRNDIGNRVVVQKNNNKYGRKGFQVCVIRNTGRIMMIFFLHKSNASRIIGGCVNSQMDFFVYISERFVWNSIKQMGNVRQDEQQLFSDEILNIKKNVTRSDGSKSASRNENIKISQLIFVLTILRMAGYIAYIYRKKPIYHT